MKGWAGRSVVLVQLFLIGLYSYSNTQSSSFQSHQRGIGDVRAGESLSRNLQWCCRKGTVVHCSAPNHQSTGIEKFGFGRLTVTAYQHNAQSV